MSSKEYNRVCACCGKEYVARHAKGVYCSTNCRSNAKQKRQRAELAQYQELGTEALAMSVEFKKAVDLLNEASKLLGDLAAKAA